MYSIEKARIRIEHWISHNDHHREEYDAFAKDLEDLGKSVSAGHVRELIDLASKSNDCLKRALKGLDE